MSWTSADRAITSASAPPHQMAQFAGPDHVIDGVPHLLNTGYELLV